jgi:hypothetical protein
MSDCRDNSVISNFSRQTSTKFNQQDKLYLQGLLRSEVSQEIELVDMGRIDEEDRRFLIVDKDTGDVYD